MQSNRFYVRMTRIGDMTLGELIDRYSISKEDLIDFLNEFPNLDYLDRNTPLDRVIPSKYVLAVRERFWSSSNPPTGLKIVGKIDLSVFDPRKTKKRERSRIAPTQRKNQSKESRPLSQKEKEIEMANDELESQREEELRKQEEQAIILESDLENTSGDVLDEDADWAMEHGTYGEYLIEQELEEINERIKRKKEQERLAKEEEKRQREKELQAICDIINNGTTESYSYDASLSIEYRYNSWRVVFAPKDACFLVDVKGRVVFQFPSTHYYVDRRDEGVVFLSGSIKNHNTIYYSRSFLRDSGYVLKVVYRIDCINQQIALWESFLNNEMFPRLRFETVYDERKNTLKKNICIGEHPILPEAVYTRLDAFRSSNLLVLLGVRDDDGDVMFVPIKNSNQDSIAKQIISHKRPIRINTPDIIWVEKTYLHLTKRYPMVEYKDSQGWHLLFKDVRFDDPFIKPSIAALYYSLYGSDRRRVSWARLRNVTKEHLEYDDLGEDGFVYDSIIVCGKSELFLLNGSLYYSFDKNFQFVDSWFEYLAYQDKELQTHIFEFVRGKELYYQASFGDNREEFRVVSPQYGVITGVYKFDELKQKMWDIGVESNRLVAIDSYGEEHPIFLSDRIASYLSCSPQQMLEKINNVADRIVILGLGNNTYCITTDTEPLIVEVQTDYKEEDGRHLLYFDSKYECFDIDKGKFVPTPGLDAMMKEIEKREREYELENTVLPTYSILDALDGDRSNYWNID